MAVKRDMSNARIWTDDRGVPHVSVDGVELKMVTAIEFRESVDERRVAKITVLAPQLDVETELTDYEQKPLGG